MTCNKFYSIILKFMGQDVHFLRISGAPEAAISHTESKSILISLSRLFLFNLKTF